MSETVYVTNSEHLLGAEPSVFFDFFKAEEAIRKATRKRQRITPGQPFKEIENEIRMQLAEYEFTGSDAQWAGLSESGFKTLDEIEEAGYEVDECSQTIAPALQWNILEGYDGQGVRMTVATVMIRDSLFGFTINSQIGEWVATQESFWDDTLEAAGWGNLDVDEVCEKLNDFLVEKRPHFFHVERLAAARVTLQMAPDWTDTYLNEGDDQHDALDQLNEALRDAGLDLATITEHEDQSILAEDENGNRITGCLYDRIAKIVKEVLAKSDLWAHNRRKPIEMNIRILRTDSSVTKQTTKTPCYRDPVTAMAFIGSALRATDPTVCAIRTDKKKATWVGHATQEHADTIARMERDGVDW